MFSFFQKKAFLADYLHGLVDIHNHILPGIDDGAKTVDESLELICEFRDLGVTNFICTPHIMHNYYPNTRETITKSHAQLVSEMERQNVDDVRVNFSAEHMIDENFESILSDGKVIPLKTEYLLVEMSYLQPSISFENAIRQISKAQYYPILAHPERYSYFHNRSGIYESLKQQGIYFQLNLLSLAPNVYGKSVQKCTYKLLEKEMIDFIASDVHNIRQLRAIKEVQLPNSLLNTVLKVVENTIQTFY